MEIHKPKAAHSWREFLIEIGTIVCGILIALGLEQVIVRVEWSHRVLAAEEAMRQELLVDDGPEVNERVAMHDCLTGKLDEIRRAVETDAPRTEVVRLAEGYKLDFVTYDTFARDDASHSGVIDHISADELYTWNKSYGMMQYMERTNAEEASDIGRLRALRRTGGRLTEAEQGQVLAAVEALRVQEQRMWTAAGFMLANIRVRGALDPQRTAEFLANARAWYGATCVKDAPSS